LALTYRSLRTEISGLVVPYHDPCGRHSCHVLLCPSGLSRILHLCSTRFNYVRLILGPFLMVKETPWIRNYGYKIPDVWPDMGSMCPNKSQPASLPGSLFTWDPVTDRTDLVTELSTLYLSVEAKIFDTAGKFILIQKNGQVGQGLESHALYEIA